MIQSRITSAVLRWGSLARISIVVCSKQSLSSSSYSTLSLIFFIEILSCSHIIIVIRSYSYRIRHKSSRPFIDFSEPSIRAQKLKPSGFWLLGIGSFKIKTGASEFNAKNYTAVPIIVGSSFGPFLPWNPTTIKSISYSFAVWFNTSFAVSPSLISKLWWR